MRLYCRRLGYSLNEHNLVRRINEEEKSELPVPGLYQEEVWQQVAEGMVGPRTHSFDKSNRQPPVALMGYRMCLSFLGWSTSTRTSATFETGVCRPVLRAPRSHSDATASTTPFARQKRYCTA